MVFKNNDNRILLRVILLLCSLLLAALLIASGKYVYLFIIVPVIIYQVIDMNNYQQRVIREMNQFVESIHYRDFSRNFDVKNAPARLQPLRKSFNDINATLRVISKEKETQYQYLQKILELVDTGILSFKVSSGEVIWMNESLKKMLELPYLKTIESLKRRDGQLFEEISNLQPGVNKIVSVQLANSSFKIILSGTIFQTDGEQYTLVAFQNVDEALDETEARAWQKLLSVMTHEIMNSIAPISSLADTLKHRVNELKAELNNQTGSVDDLELGIDTIKRRSEGLLKFAETYRNLNKITTLNLKKLYVLDLFENLNRLMQPTLDQKQIEMDIVLKDTALMLEADTSLIEQVLINLVVNSIEAVKDKPEPSIILTAYRDANSRVIIKVQDNGQGIPEEALDKVFVPFFTTKKTGSGIGLSLCKQIMMLHKGNIQVQSGEGVGTVFLLQF